MKRSIVSMIAALVVLCACAGPVRAEEVQNEVQSEAQTVQAQTEAAPSYPSIPHMSLEEYPKVDGSLACVPLMEALVREVTGCTQTEAEESLTSFSNTNPAYERLMGASADLILCYEASAETKEKLEQAEKAGENTMDLRPVGRDALVFLVNAGNPVEGLTSQQIHDIYTGEIRNWKEVGGEDVEIKAFQRRENSGSQTLMRLLLMGDEEIPEKQMISISEMEGLLNTVMEYDNTANAIGYSVYYYASVMMGNDRLKFLAVDGAVPNNETIRSGEYALSNPFYCGISKKSGENAVLLRDWLLSAEGQRFVEDNGYTAAGGEEAQLFDPNLYLGIGSGVYRSAGGEAADMLVRYYDSHGEFHGEALGIVDYFSGTFSIIEDGRLILDYDNEDVVVRRTEDFREICRYGRKERSSGRIFEGRDHIGILSEDRTHLAVYDREGQVCADLKTDGLIKPPSEEGDAGAFDYVILEPDDCLYIRLMQGEEVLLAALIGEDGSLLSSEDPSFPQNLNSVQVSGSIGKYLIVMDDLHGWQIADVQGEVLYEDAGFHWAWSGNFQMTDAQNRADFAYVRVEGSLHILNGKLEDLGRIRDTDLDKYGRLQCAEGTVIGLPSDKLGGECSTDLVPYLRRNVPAVKVSGGYRVFDEMGGFLPDPEEGWELSCFSDRFILLSGEGKRRVLRRSDGQVLVETEQQVYIQNTSFAVIRNTADPDSRTVIYDENKNELYTCDRWIFPCMDDWYFLSRGAWAGAVDAEGNWILRELQFDE